MSREHSYMNRNLWEKMNGYPSRFGTARRAGHGRLLPGEYNGRGERLGSNSAPDLTLTKPHDWSGFDKAFGPRGNGSSEDAAGEGLGRGEVKSERDERAAMERDRARRSREMGRERQGKREREKAPRRDDLHALNRGLKRAFAGKTHSMDAPAPNGGGATTPEQQSVLPRDGTPGNSAPQPGAQQPDAPQAAAPQPAASQSAAPRETRTTSYGSIETKDPATGRWVGSVSNAPAANRSRMGGDDSPTSPRLVPMKPIPKLLTGPRGSKADDAANMEQSRRMYASGGMAEAAPTRASWWNADKDSPEIQGMLDGNARSNPDRAASDGAWKSIVANGGKNQETKTPYGPVKATGFPEQKAATAPGPNAGEKPTTAPASTSTAVPPPSEQDVPSPTVIVIGSGPKAPAPGTPQTGAAAEANTAKQAKRQKPPEEV